VLFRSFAGAIVALLLNGNVGYPSPAGYRGLAGDVFFEAIWTAFYVLVVCAVMTPTTGAADERVTARGHSRSFHGLAIGAAVFAGVVCAQPGAAGSGGVFNPAIGLAIVFMNAVVKGADFGRVWIYAAGPFAGAVAGAALFVLLHVSRSVGADAGGAHAELVEERADDGGGAKAAFPPLGDVGFKSSFGSPRGAAYGYGATDDAQGGYGGEPSFTAASPGGRYAAPAGRGSFI
jgi:hypothetical protein